MTRLQSPTPGGLSPGHAPGQQDTHASAEVVLLDGGGTFEPRSAKMPARQAFSVQNLDRNDLVERQGILLVELAALVDCRGGRVRNRSAGEQPNLN